MNRFDKIYVKDFDSNIIKTEIPIVLEKVNSDGTFTMETIDPLDFNENYELYKWPSYRLLNDDGEEAFQYARDYLAGSQLHPWPDIMIQQVTKALQWADFSPSMYKFVNEVLKKANPYAINTARGNWMDSIKQSIYIINQELLTDNEKKDQIDIIKDRYQLNEWTDTQILRKYLDNNCYLPVNNSEFCKLLEIPFELDYTKKKTFAMDWYIGYMTKFLEWYQKLSSDNKISIWFSDDTYKNIEEMLSYFLMISSKNDSHYSYYNYRLYFTWPKLEETQTRITDFLYNHLQSIPLEINFEYQKSDHSISEPDILKIIIDK
jgi:hypothetical protein